MRSVILILGLSVVVTGCGTWVTDTQINPAPRPLSARGYESVEIFSSAPPARAHVDVALLKVDQVNAMDDHLGELLWSRSACWSTDCKSFVNAVCTRTGGR